MNEQNPTRKDNGTPAKVPTVVIEWDAERHAPVVTFSECNTFDFAVALCRMAETLLEDKRRFATAQAMMAGPRAALPGELEAMKRGKAS